MSEKVENEYIEKIKKTKSFKIIYFIYAVICIVVALLGYYLFLEKFIEEKFYFPPEFSNTTNFNILILPFHKLEHQTLGEKNYEEALEKRFNDLYQSDIQVIYDKKNREIVDSYETAYKIGNERKADLVVFGECYEQNNSYEANLKFVYLTKVINRIALTEDTNIIYTGTYDDIDSFLVLALRKETGYVKFNSVSDISKGFVQKDLENYINILMMLKADNNKNYQLSLDLSKNLTRKLDKIDYELFKFQIECLQKINDYNVTIEFYTFMLSQVKDYSTMKQQSIDSVISIIYLNRGVAYNRQKKFNEALNDFDSVITLDKNNSLVYLNRGSSYNDQKLYDLALMDYKKGLEIEPTHYKLYGRMGMVYFNQGNYAEAKQMYMKNINGNSYSPDLFKNFGILFLHENNPDSALILFNKSIEMDSNYLLGYYYKGRAFMLKKDYLFAINEFNETIKLNAEYKPAYQQRAFCYHELKNYNRSLIDYNKLIQLESNSSEYYNERGYNYIFLQKYISATEDFNKSISLNENNAFAYNNRGLAYSYLKKFDLAYSDFEKSKELDPSNSYLYKHMGIYYELKGDRISAINNYKVAIEKNPEFKGELEQKIRNLSN